jgi:hypothetical protein
MSRPRPGSTPASRPFCGDEGGRLGERPFAVAGLLRAKRVSTPANDKCMESVGRSRNPRKAWVEVEVTAQSADATQLEPATLPRR